MKRMDRYEETISKPRRSELNQDLYQDNSLNLKYADITEITNPNAYEMSNTKSNSREEFQQMKKYGLDSTLKSKKELDNFNYLYSKQERKIYDINSVLEDARKNRKEQDDLEEKRKLKYTSYNILAGVNLEELIRYREEKKKRDATPEEKEIRELMDTIASKTLAGELDKETTVDLLSDLMATSVLDKVAPQKSETEELDITDYKEGPKTEIEDEKTEENLELDEAIEESQEIVTVENTNEQKIDTDFYTKSMDLSEEDFGMADDFQEKGLPLIVKIILVILFIAILAVAAYFIYQRIN